MSGSPTVRHARNWTEVERSAAGAGRAFPSREPEGAFFRERTLGAPSLPLDNTLLLFVGGSVVSSLQVYERQLTVSGTPVWTGAIGNMYTLPGYRGRGYGTRLLRYARRVIEEKGYPLSMLLSSRHEFYGEVGWEPLPFLRHRSPEPRRLDPAATTGQWEAFAPDRHLDRVREIYRTELQPRDGRVVRPGSLWTDWILAPEKEVLAGDQLLVYTENGTVQGYLLRESEDGGLVCPEVAYTGTDTAGFLRSAWNVLAEDSEGAVVWEPATGELLAELEASRQPVEAENQEYCMIQLHDPAILSTLTDGAVTTTDDLVDYLADGGWHWSSADHF